MCGHVCVFTLQRVHTTEEVLRLNSWVSSGPIADVELTGNHPVELWQGHRWGDRLEVEGL